MIQSQQGGVESRLQRGPAQCSLLSPHPPHISTFPLQKVNYQAETCKAHGDKMVSLMHNLPVFGCSPLRVSISIREALKVVITLGEDPHNCVEITLQPTPQSALDELER
jgi:hypothetical protein